MKKIISAILALSLATATSASVCATNVSTDSLPADANATVSLNVAPDYMVTIPETITLTKNTVGNTISYDGTSEISASKVSLSSTNEFICISMTSDFELETANGIKLAYTVKVGNTAVTAANKLVAKFGTSNNPQSVTLSYSAPNPDYAGTYTDIATFTVEKKTITPVVQ